MTHLFFKAANFVSNRATVQLRNVEPLIQVLETDAYGHWIFGDDANSLTDKVNSRNLTLQSSAVIQPVYSQNSVTISAVAGNALLSSLNDTSEQSVTLCAVVKCSVTSLAIILGNLVKSSSTDSSGLSPFVSENKAFLTVKPSNVNAPSFNGIASLDSGATINQLNTFFIACSINKQTKTGSVYVYQDSIEASNTATYTGTYTTSNNKISIGNVAYSSNVTTSTLTFNEAIIYDKALTVDQIKAVAMRSKDRMSDRNIYF